MTKSFSVSINSFKSYILNSCSNQIKILKNNYKLSFIKSFTLALFFFVFTQYSYQQRCPDGFFWCGGKLCYNTTLFNTCCGTEGINDIKTQCCYKSDYSDYNYKCELPKKCCGKYNCFSENNENCCKSKSYSDDFICKKDTQFCCDSKCCELNQECCKDKCCEFGYRCNNKYYSSSCEFTYDLRFLPIPISITIIGFFFIIPFIKDKFCGNKAKKIGILNETNSKTYTGSHTHELTMKDINPERINDIITEKNLNFNSHKEFEKFILGFIQKLFYKSAIAFFVFGMLPFYLIVINRDYFLVNFLFSLLAISRLFHLILILKGKTWVKCTHFSFGIFIYSLILFVGMLIYAIKSDDDDRLGMRLGASILCFFSSFPVFGKIKMEISGDELIVRVQTVMSASGRDNYGNTYSHTSEEHIFLKIKYPENLKIKNSNENITE